MEGLRSEIVSTVTGESTILRLWSNKSTFPVTIEKRPPTPLTKISACPHCGDRVVTLFCRGDDTLLCRPCKYEHHMKCHVDKIAHAAQGVFETGELQTLTKELTALKLVFQKLKENKRLKKLQHRQQKLSMLKLSQRWKMLQSTRTVFDKELGVGIDKHQVDVDAYERVLARKSRWVVQQISEYLKILMEYVDEGNEVGAYIVLHKSNKDLKEFKDVLNEISADQNHADIFEVVKIMVDGIYHCENQGNVTLARILNANSKINLGQTQPKRDRNPQTPSVHSRSPRSIGTSLSRGRLPSGNRRFRPAFKPQTIRMATMISSLRSDRSSRGLTQTTIDLKRLVVAEPPKLFTILCESDKTEDCSISAMICLHDGKLLLLDCRNNKIKLFSSQNKFITEKLLECSVWDFTMINKTDTLVTCPAEGKLLRVKIARSSGTYSLNLSGYIITQKECRAICFVKNRIYISYNGPMPCIKILSDDGTMYRSIDGTSMKSECPLFKNPLHMFVSKLGKIIYVSDFSLQRVIKIDQKGNLLGTYDLSPGWPVGLSSDKEGNVIVAVSGNSDIKIITKGSNKAKTLIGPRTLEGEPCTVVVKETIHNKQLYVACDNNSTIKIFQLR